MEICNNYFPSYRVNKTFFESLTLTFDKKLLPEGLNVWINYALNLLDHVGVVAKSGGIRRVDKINMAAVASFSVVHENGPIDSQTPKTYIYQVSKQYCEL